MKEMAAGPNMFANLTEAYHPRLSDRRGSDELPFLRDRLEFLYDAFGEDRVIFGGDYPNSYGVATIAEEVALPKRFFAENAGGRGGEVLLAELRVYKWIERLPEAPTPV